MKKFFTLFMGVLFTLSAVAAPFQIGKKHAPQAPKFVTERALPQQAGALRAPKAGADVDSLAVIYEEDRYFANYGLYVYMLATEQGTFFFSFSSTGADPVVNGQTYTLADMVADYCYLDYYDAGVYYFDFAQVSFKKTVDTDGNVLIIVSLTDTYDYQYYLVYDEASLPQAPAGGTFSNLEVDSYVWTDSCQYVLSNDSLQFYFAFDVENLVSGQAYTESNMVAQYTGIIFNNYTIIEIATLSFVKTDGANGAYSIAATITDADGNNWTVSGSYVPEISDMTFTFSADATGITVTPSNDDDAWDFIVVSETVFNQYGADYIATNIYQQYGNYYAQPGAAVLAFDEDLSYYLTESGNYVLVVWGAGEKNVTTPAAHYAFSYSAQAIENTEVELKAVKRFENGVLVIEKNGVLYNAQGAILK